MTSPRLQQLYIIRSQLDFLIAMELMGEKQFDIPAYTAVCPHPEDKRRQAHNMGQEPAFLCLACGETVPGVA